MPDAHDTETLAEVLAAMLCYERHGSGTPAEQDGACPNCTSRAEQVWLPRIVQARAGEGALRERAKVITLCGSTRFKSDFESWNSRLTLDGHVVISVGVFGHGYHPYHREKYLDPKKPMLDRLHLQKIDMADEVFVIDPGGYIGESTRREIAYAESKGIPVRRLSREDPTCVECGRDNRNGTHAALERFGHLTHPFRAVLAETDRP